MTVIGAPLLAGALDPGTGLALRLPVEAILVLLLAVAVPNGVIRRVAAYAFGAVTVIAALVALLDLSFRGTIDRGFAATEDWRAVINAYKVVQDVVGPITAALAALVVIGVAVAAVFVVGRCVLRCALTVTRLGARGRTAVAAAATAWVILSVVGAQHPTGAAVAAADVTRTLVGEAVQAAESIPEQVAFERAIQDDSLANSGRDDLLAGLRGKDVVIAFVESYGEVAVSGAGPMAGITRLIDESAERLTENGYRAESAFLTSPTFGGVSWLAHGTLQSGARVDTQQKYDTLLSSERMTLSRLFGDAGWRTVTVNPAHTEPWPEGAAFYGFDRMLDERELAFDGPAFGFARVPDQYTWQRFFDEELARGGAPIMAEVSLVSSHTPWTPTPRLVPWSDLGDGSIFAGQLDDGATASVWPDEHRVRADYAESMEYSLGATLSFLETYDPADLVLVLVGDHQPSRVVSGPDADSDVPVTIVSKDPAVFGRIEAWGWDAGFRPSANAPVLRMDAFRDRFVDAFSG
ncbi:sulfatase-like hydrolase/transferase [Microbacterium sp. ET2]|uniref:sulfatase-like hydrolase/transferase n=1 Tax=Microbacterium albipurpureum TaxID=3050384 RepID=UPI00259C88F2|nr:sulfatase-like hydrolase/transferase [Microbacterium sp. ET2 (Ac-2212)]WJL96136.1 sulfatase-like hydrolase/transferase [Microbacterium sp. ET2 (Ac-2212)]